MPAAEAALLGWQACACASEALSCALSLSFCGLYIIGARGVPAAARRRRRACAAGGDARWYLCKLLPACAHLPQIAHAPLFCARHCAPLRAINKRGCCSLRRRVLRDINAHGMKRSYAHLRRAHTHSHQGRLCRIGSAHTMAQMKRAYIIVSAETTPHKQIARNAIALSSRPRTRARRLACARRGCLPPTPLAVFRPFSASRLC